MKKKLAAVLALAALASLGAVLPGCMVVPLAEPAPLYVAPARPVVVHPHHRHHWRGPRYRY
jgi:hypothetical protein